jgi:hypothetical protein
MVRQKSQYQRSPSKKTKSEIGTRKNRKQKIRPRSTFEIRPIKKIAESRKARIMG